MKRIDHPLPSQVPGNQRQLSSWHFGVAGAQPRVYIQAGLHADELPGILVAHQLQKKLEELEQSGLIAGEIILVPVANPIGLGQFKQGQHQGRFDGASGRNFNRGFPDLVDSAAEILQECLTDQPEHNQQQVRRALHQALDASVGLTELDAMQKILLKLALDADVVLDLHCDSEAAMHVYVHSEQLETGTVLAAHLGAVATLHASEQGGQSFDDTLTRQWCQLIKRYQDYPIPFACFAATIELRGQADVDAEMATQDAIKLIAFLEWSGAIDNVEAYLRPPALLHAATPLNCVEVLLAPSAGVVLYCADVGRLVQAGQVLAVVLEPLTGVRHPLVCSQPGMYYARVTQRYAQAGTELCYVAGQTPQRRTHLLSA